MKSCIYYKFFQKLFLVFFELKPISPAEQKLNFKNKVGSRKKTASILFIKSINIYNHFILSFILFIFYYPIRNLQAINNFIWN